MTDKKPCCAADTLQRIRQVKINGMMTGIAMLDESIDEVQAQNLRNDSEINAALMNKIRIYNYIPKSVEEEYEKVFMEELKNRSQKSNTKKFE